MSKAELTFQDDGEGNTWMKLNFHTKENRPQVTSAHDEIQRSIIAAYKLSRDEFAKLILAASLPNGVPIISNSEKEVSQINPNPTLAFLGGN
jgi:hypothetical protein